MGKISKIEWCDATVNFWAGCTKVSAACDFCYAEVWAKRSGFVGWGHGAPRRKVKNAVPNAFKLAARAKAQGRCLRVFSNSLADLFDNEVPDSWRDEAMAVIALTPELDWLVLTKRPKVARAYIDALLDETRRWQWLGDAAGPLVGNIGYESAGECAWPLPNLRLGISAEDQKMADLRIPELLATPAALRFVSAEPLLGPIDLRRWLSRLDWVIAGGESGPKARPMHPDWARSLRDQCQAAGVPFFFKQWGEWIDADQWLDHLQAGPSDLLFGGRPWRPARPLNFDDAARLAQACNRRHWQHNSDGSTVIRVGKTAAGRTLDGVIWDQWPA